MVGKAERKSEQEKQRGFSFSALDFAPFSTIWTPAETGYIARRRGGGGVGGVVTLGIYWAIILVWELIFADRWKNQKN